MRLTYDRLPVTVMESNQQLGHAAAAAFAEIVNSQVEQRGDVAVVLATGNSQLSFVRALRDRDDVPWSRISVLHMDEYLGMTEEEPPSFRRWMQEKVVRHVAPKEFYGMRGDHEPVEEEVARYSRLLHDLEPVLCVMGIGENGHLAFNDPPGDFTTTSSVNVVTLDEACRRQQVREGHFGSLSETPERALTMTIPALLRPPAVLVLAPEARKAPAVKRALEGPVSPDCPASILRTVDHASLYLDVDSAKELDAFQ
jgi:glucosamine-6-phosphate deaminase